MAFPPSEAPKKWLTMLRKLSSSIGGVPSVLFIHSQRTTGTYVRPSGGITLPTNAPRECQGSMNGREESSGSNDPPPPSSDEDERKSDSGREKEREKPHYFPKLSQHRAGGGIPHLMDRIANPLSVGGPEEDSRLSNAPSTSSDEDIKEEVSYLWEIIIAAPCLTDVQEQRMARTQSTPRIRTPDELLVEGTTEGNLHSTLISQGPSAEVVSASTSPSRDGVSTSSSSDEASTSSSLDGASTSSSSRGASSGPRRAVLRKRDRAQVELVLEVVVDGTIFPRAPACLDPQDGLSTHFPNPQGG
ncbi:hypothetical protein Cgig2_006613 [Carnegiea gigantea]|uniref:Uncharacterized protein n=1 Tax=Carnegiea gigantea TaxID=171969 RepID=A0A9Q1QNW8_9CARY|nr:hypothetical protein Cgig2_006613 [Carnegiea gigantea]